MPWLVGIDEAGYGPNLGPFVMSMASVYVPDDLADADLWHTLSAAVRHYGGPSDGRIVVDDSKLVYSSARGLGSLEENLHPFALHGFDEPCPLEQFWDRCGITPLTQLTAEPWYAPGLTLPLHGPHAAALEMRAGLQRCCENTGVRFGPMRACVIFPRQFNALTKEYDSKAAAPCWAITQLLNRWQDAPHDSITRIHIDKLSGRNRYLALLQPIFPDHMVMCLRETAASSSYRAHSRSGEYEISFQPESDSKYLPVALASMLSKYLRELMMEMFNRFWKKHLPELKPTAGYPSDARRFFDDTRSMRKKLGIADEVLWRVR